MVYSWLRLIVHLSFAEIRSLVLCTLILLKKKTTNKQIKAGENTKSLAKVIRHNLKAKRMSQWKEQGCLYQMQPLIASLWSVCWSHHRETDASFPMIYWFNRSSVITFRPLAYHPKAPQSRRQRTLATAAALVSSECWAAAGFWRRRDCWLEHLHIEIGEDEEEKVGGK